jgi:protein kinase A
MDHNWFKGVDWNVVGRKEIPPPWIPEVSNDIDTTFFDNYPDSGSPTKIPSEQEQKLFEDF